MSVLGTEVDVELVVVHPSRLMQTLFFTVFALSSALANAMSPILNITNPGREIPMLQEALRDPELAYELIADEADAKRLAAEAANQAADLAKLEAKDGSRLTLIESLTKTYARLAYFYEDVQLGRVPAQLDGGKVENLIFKNRSEAVRYANQLLAFKEANQAQAIYVIGMSQILNQDNSGFNYLRQNKKILGKDRNARVEFLGLMKGRNKDTPELRRNLAALMAALGSKGQVAGLLFIAQTDAQKKNASYKASLSKAVQLSSKFAEADRDRVLAFAAQLYERSERNADWSKFPVDVKSMDLDNARAIRERAALQASKGRNLSPALQFYRSIVERSRGTARLAPVLDRILDIEEMTAQNSRSYSGYEKALVASLEITSDKSCLGRGRESEAQATKSRIQKRYRGLVSQLIASSKQSQASRDLRSQTIRIASTFVANAALPAEKIPVRADIGRIYALNGQHAEAVKVYMDLNKETQGEQAQQFLLAAMDSQRILAKWPASAPWSSLPKENANARRYLADMYDQRFAATQSWSDLAHVGLLAINLGDSTKAFSAWTKQLEKNPQGSEAQLASGLMLTAYRSGKSWQKLEDLARLVIKVKVIAKFGGRSLDAVALLGDALFEGGKELYAQKNYPASADKLDEFVKKYVKDSRRPEGFFALAKSAHMANRHPRSIEALLSLVSEYPNSPFEHDALLFGGDWTIPMAWEEQTIFFYQRFVDRFASDAKTPNIRMILANLYIGRELYGNAVRIYAAHVEDKKVSLPERIRTALLVMHTEERYGEAKYAAWGAKRARELSNQDPRVVGEVLSFEARRAAAVNDLAKAKQIEGQLSKISVNDRDVVESTAQLRYLIAEKQAGETKQDIFNLAQSDPNKTLAVAYSIFLKVKNAYESVCAPGPSTYCGLAMLRLSEITRFSLNSIENLTIAQTLDEKTVRNFEGKKLGVINVITKTAARADAMAMGISEKGESTPEWSQEIVVTNSENALERSHGATGGGYIQWQPVKVEND